MSETCLDHFGLCQAPFGPAPDPALFYVSRAHQRALDWIENGIAARAPFLTLTGAAGTGKTTLLRLLLDRHAGDWTAALVPAHSRPDDILSQARQAFRLAHQGDGPAVASGQIRRLAQKTRANGGFVVLMVDDAQALGADGLSALTSLNGAGGGALTLLLAGRPELRDLLDASELGSRDMAHAILDPLGAGDTAGYVGHRLARSGARAPIFDADAMQVLHSLGQGVPRSINVMADHCLTTAAAKGMSQLDGAWVAAALHQARELDRFAGLATQGPPQSTGDALSDAPQPAWPDPVPHLGTSDMTGGAAQAPAAAAQPPRTAGERRPDPDARDPPAAGSRPAGRGPDAAPLAAAAYPVVDPVPLSRRRSGLRLLVSAAVLALAGGAAWLWFQPGHMPGPVDTGVAPPLTRAAEPAAAPQPLQPAALPPAAVESTEPVPAPVGITPEPTVTALMQRALEVETYDPAQAAVAYARAAIRGDARAAYFLGQFHETGTGVEPGAGLARMWYAAAADLPAAQRRLQALPAGSAAPGVPAPPVPIFQARPGSGVSEMIWRVPAGVTPVRFRVEAVGPAGQPLPVPETTVPGLIVAVPVTAWRVVAIGADGTESAPSATVRMIPEVVPWLQRTLRWLRIEPR